MCDEDCSKRHPTLVERFEYRGFHGRRGFCSLEIFPLLDGRTAVIATELKDNPGTSITNVAEHLASYVCDQLLIDPDKLMWIVHYGYGSTTGGDRTFDLVTFRRRTPERVVWSRAVTDAKPDGWPGHFDDPQWRAMTDADWQALGVPPRQ